MIIFGAKFNKDFGWFLKIEIDPYNNKSKFSDLYAQDY